LTCVTLSTLNFFRGVRDLDSSADDHIENSNACKLAQEEDDSSRNFIQLEYTEDDIHLGCAAKRQQKCPNKGN